MAEDEIEEEVKVHRSFSDTNVDPRARANAQEKLRNQYVEAKKKLGIKEENKMEENKMGENNGGFGKWVMWLIVAWFVYQGLQQMSVWGVLMHQTGVGNEGISQIVAGQKDANSGIQDILTGMVDMAKAMNTMSGNQKTMYDTMSQYGERLTNLERTQQSQGGILSKILDIVSVDGSTQQAQYEQQQSGQQAQGYQDIPQVLIPVPTASSSQDGLFASP